MPEKKRIAIGPIVITIITCIVLVGLAAVLVFIFLPHVKREKVKGTVIWVLHEPRFPRSKESIKVQLDDGRVFKTSFAAKYLERPYFHEGDRVICLVTTSPITGTQHIRAISKEEEITKTLQKYPTLLKLSYA